MTANAIVDAVGWGVARHEHLQIAPRGAWTASNILCDKGPKPFLTELVKSLNRHREINSFRKEQGLPLTVNAATTGRHLPNTQLDRA